MCWLRLEGRQDETSPFLAGGRRDIAIYCNIARHLAIYKTDSETSTQTG